MTRFILVDNASGYVWGDSADLASRVSACDTPILTAAALDASLGEPWRAYEEVAQRALASNETGYHVYRAPASFPTGIDGQDPAVIEAVERDCEYVTTLRCSNAEEAV
jgi:hypothetical protein